MQQKVRNHTYISSKNELVAIAGKERKSILMKIIEKYSSEIKRSWYYPYFLGGTTVDKKIRSNPIGVCIPIYAISLERSKECPVA